MRQMARARIELAVAQPLVLEHHRVRLRRARNLRREQLGRVAPEPPARSRSTPAGWCDARSILKMARRNSAEPVQRSNRHAPGTL